MSLGEALIIRAAKTVCGLLKSFDNLLLALIVISHFHKIIACQTAWSVFCQFITGLPLSTPSSHVNGEIYKTGQDRILLGQSSAAWCTEALSLKPGPPEAGSSSVRPC